MHKSNSFLSIERRTLNSTNNSTLTHYVLMTLLSFHTRPKTIISLLKHMDSSISITDREIGRLYKELHGCASTRGMSAYNTSNLISTSEKKLHASIYANLISKYLKFHPDNKTYALIEAYNEYLLVIKSNPSDAFLSFTNAVTVKQSLDTNTLNLVKCTKCNCKFVHIACHPVVDSSCPACALGRKNEFAVKANERKNIVTDINDSVKRKASEVQMPVRRTRKFA